MENRKEKPARKTNKPKEIPAEIYTSMFEGHPDGTKILAELAFLFYDQPCPINADAALYQGGQRSVIQFILSKCAEGQK